MAAHDEFEVSDSKRLCCHCFCCFCDFHFFCLEATLCVMYVHNKRLGHNTYIAPQAETVAAAALCVTDRAGVQPIGPRLCQRPRDLHLYDEQPYTTAVCRLMVSAP